MDISGRKLDFLIFSLSGGAFCHPLVTIISEDGINSGINLAEKIDSLDGIGIADCLKKTNQLLN